MRESHFLVFGRRALTFFIRPRYITGHSINLGMIGFSMILVLVNITYCKWENRQRDNGKRDVRLQEGDEGMLGFRHPEFRYTI